MNDQSVKLGRRRVLQLGAGLAALATVPPFARAIAAPVLTPAVTTTNGAVQGFVDHGIFSFKGRYGAPPIGSQRFKPPQKPAAWQGALDAIGYGAPAMQMNMRPPPATELSRQLSTIFTYARRSENRQRRLSLFERVVDDPDGDIRRLYAKK